MTQIIIEYVLQGTRKGYNITSGADDLPDDVVKAVWRQAMPRGTGWSAYTGARAIKAFALPDGQIAVSTVTVTDATDESGRAGIRRAVVDLIPAIGFERHLRQMWTSYPPPITAIARERCAHLARKLPRIKPKQTLVLTSAFQSAQSWQLIEAVILCLMLDPPRRWQNHNPPFPFTTLALDHLAENPLIAMPAERADGLAAFAVR